MSSVQYSSFFTGVEEVIPSGLIFAVPTAAAPTALGSATAVKKRTRANAAQQEGFAGLHPWQGIRGG